LPRDVGPIGVDPVSTLRDAVATLRL
jgi:hypothetical protein